MFPAGEGRALILFGGVARGELSFLGPSPFLHGCHRGRLHSRQGVAGQTPDVLASLTLRTHAAIHILDQAMLLVGTAVTLTPFWLPPVPGLVLS